MKGTFSKIHIHLVFAVKGRNSLISLEWEDEIYKYIAGIIISKGQKVMAINGTPDHIHLFIGLRPNCVLSDLVREIKKSSTSFINEKKLSKTKFNWQNGYGAFSYAQSQIPTVVRYILNQKEHHQVQSFKTEYINYLKRFELDYDEKYLFDWIDDINI